MKKWTPVKCMGLFFGICALSCLVLSAIWEGQNFLFRIGMLELCIANLLLIWERRHGANKRTDEREK